LAATQTFSPYGDILWHADAFPIICQGILFITETLPKQPKTHPLGKIAASLKPFPKVGKYQPGMDAHAFGRKSGFVGASAWEAISSRGKDWC